MAKYGIIDLEILEQLMLNKDIDNKVLNMIGVGCLLSPEETEDKFKQIWEDGFESALSAPDDDGEYQIEQWESTKDTL